MRIWTYSTLRLQIEQERKNGDSGGICLGKTHCLFDEDGVRLALKFKLYRTLPGEIVSKRLVLGPVVCRGQSHRQTDPHNVREADFGRLNLIGDGEQCQFKIELKPIQNPYGHQK